MQVNTRRGADFYLWAGPTLGTSQFAGMDWNAGVSPPTANFGAGSLLLVQLVIPDRSFIDATTLDAPTSYWSWNGQEGLDTGYPYSWLQGAPSYESNDNPGLDLTFYNARSAHVGDQFEDYLMYFAPGSTQCVPLARFVWTTNGNANLPSTGYWADYGSGSAGLVTPSGTPTNFVQSNSFPMWIQIISSDNGHYSSSP